MSHSSKFTGDLLILQQITPVNPRILHCVNPGLLGGGNKAAEESRLGKFKISYGLRYLFSC